MILYYFISCHMLLLKIYTGNPKIVDLKKLIKIKSHNAEWSGKPQEYKEERLCTYWNLDFHKSQKVTSKLKFYCRGNKGKSEVNY